MGMILNVIGVEPQQNHRYTQIPVCKTYNKMCYWRWVYTASCASSTALDNFWRERRYSEDSEAFKNYCHRQNITIDTTLPHWG